MMVARNDERLDPCSAAPHPIMPTASEDRLSSSAKADDPVRFNFNLCRLLDARFRGHDKRPSCIVDVCSERGLCACESSSVFCVKSGGKSEIRKGPAGAYGLCRLPDGRVVEEWTYFREMKGKADTPR